MRGLNFRKKLTKKEFRGKQPWRRWHKGNGVLVRPPKVLKGGKIDAGGERKKSVGRVGGRTHMSF